MNSSYRRPLRRSLPVQRTTSRRRTKPRSGSASATPIVAFLLIASFGILFAGCSFKGPDQANTDTDTFVFTEQDVARFQELANRSSSAPASAGVSTSSGPAQPVTSAPSSQASSSSSSSSSSAVVDLSQLATYDSIRSNPAVAGSSTYRVTNSILNVRAQPSVGSSLVVTLHEGDALTLFEFVNGEWAKVTTSGGKTGFVSVRYISKVTTEDKLAEEKKTFENLYYVSFQFVNVREQPNQSSAKVGQIPGRAFVKVITTDGKWAKVNFDNKEGYVSMEYLTRFEPNFIVRQNSFYLPVFVYHASEPDMATKLVAQAKELRASGVKLITLRDFQALLVRQETRTDARLPAKSAVIAVADVTGGNVKDLSAALYSNSIPATLFVQTKNLGISGITDKTVATLVANGFDLQSNGHTGDDLRSLTNAQVQLEAEQSRALLEAATKKPVFALLYPQGGANERVLQKTHDGGYLLGLSEGTSPANVTREHLLSMPAFTVTASVTADQLKALVK